MKKLLILLLLSISSTSSVYADFEDGMISYHTGDYKSALMEWQLLAEKGDAKSQYGLGMLYYDGSGVLQDYKQAAYWYTKAAEQGDSSSQFALGVMYINGKGVLRSYKDAAKWIRAAYENGYERAEEVWNKYALWLY